MKGQDVACGGSQGWKVSESQHFVHVLFLNKRCFPFDCLSSLPVNLESHCQYIFSHQVKGKETLNCSIGITAGAGTRAKLYCLGMCLGVPLSPHLMHYFPFCLSLVISSLPHHFLVPQLPFFKAFSSFSNLLHLFQYLVCCKPTWQRALGQPAFPWKQETCCAQDSSLSLGFCFLPLEGLGSWL